MVENGPEYQKIQLIVLRKSGRNKKPEFRGRNKTEEPRITQSNPVTPVYFLLLQTIRNFVLLFAPGLEGLKGCVQLTVTAPVAVNTNWQVSWLRATNNDLF